MSDLVPNGMKCEFNATQNGVPVVNRVYVTTSSAPTLGDMDDLVVAALAFFNDYKESTHESYVLNDITVTDVHVANGPQVIFPLTTGNTGLVTGTAAGGNVAIVASLRTAFTGRSFRGRWYFGGVPTAAMANAQLATTGTASALAGYFSDFIDALQDIGMTLVVVSKFAAGVARVTNLATEIISIIVNTKLDSQRRRTAN